MAVDSVAEAMPLPQAGAADGNGAGLVARPETPRLAALDGLRFVAALAVLVFHYAGSGYYQGAIWGKPTAAEFPTLAPVAVYGYLGVELFFLISGFAICMSTWGRKPGEFVVSRVARLFPAYWLAVALTATVRTLAPAPLGRPRLGDVLSNLTMLHDFLHARPVDSVYWTLRVELVFYLLMAVMLFIGLDYRRLVLFCSVWTAASLAADATGSKFMDILAMPQWSPYFIAGICFHLIHRFGSNAVLWGIVVLQWLLAQKEILVATAALTPQLGHALRTWPAVLVITGAFLVMAVLALGKLDRIRWQPLIVLGAISYPLYLLHESIGWTAIYRLHQHFGGWPIIIGVTVAMIDLAWFVARYVERPLSAALRASLKAGLAAVSAASARR
jgi:peptidoglycan/LPS O-acetylase OafA/YrhL